MQQPRILLVEDDLKIAKALMARLRSIDFSVSHAVDATTGLAAAVREQPDLIILDVSMPAGGGFFVAEKIKLNPKVAGTPFIFITASKARGVADKAKELGAAGFLEKPFSSQKLVELIQSALAEGAQVSDSDMLS